jgi:hypothetical protein
MNTAGKCLDWKVLAGLVIAGLGLWVLAPDRVGGIWPLLLLAACPLSMLLLLWWGVQYGQRAALPPPDSARRTLGNAPDPDYVSSPLRVGQGAEANAPEEQIAALKAELASVQARQEAIAREIARLEVERGAQPADAAPQAVPLPPAETSGAAQEPQRS